MTTLNTHMHMHAIPRERFSSRIVQNDEATHTGLQRVASLPSQTATQAIAATDIWLASLCFVADDFGFFYLFNDFYLLTLPNHYDGFQLTGFYLIRGNGGEGLSVGR